MVEHYRLKNNIQVVMEQLRETRTAAIGVYIESGSRHEPREKWGISHFIEHMLFKGTAHRSAAELARDWDLIGGQSNAFTSKEMTVYYATTLDRDLPRAAELLGDMLCASRFDERDFETERGVILEEINMYEDSPEDIVADRLIERVWGEHAIGREILGTAESLQALTAGDLLAYQRENYTGDNTVIAVAGHFDRGALLDALERAFAGYTPAGARRGVEKVGYVPAILLQKKEIEQNHVCLGFPGISYNDPQCFDANVAAHIFGAGMSSRLFQRVREQLGLVYSIYSFSMPQKDCGFSGIYLAGDAASEARAIGEVVELVREFVRDGVTDEELLRAKAYLCTNSVMGYESSTARMAHLAKGALVKDRILSLEEMEQGIRAVTREGILELAGRIFDLSRMSVSVVGAPGDERFYRELCPGAAG